MAEQDGISYKPGCVFTRKVFIVQYNNDLKFTGLTFLFLLKNDRYRQGFVVCAYLLMTVFSDVRLQ